MFNKVLIANRGVIACRIIRTLRKMGVRSVAVHSEADKHSPHVFEADESVLIGPPPPSQSYLAIDRILAAARDTGAEAIHPGYGFLSENAEFAEACASHGIVFIGPSPAQMRAFGLKHTARDIARSNGVPLLPGTGLLSDVAEAVQRACEIGYPVMLKSSAGGGGIGMTLCRDEQQLIAGFESVQRLSASNFGSAGVFLEKFVERARHIEVQIFGDGKGEVIALGERDCSIQRRNQKVIEETPAPAISENTRRRLLEAAVELGRTVQYESAGTVEFVYDQSTGGFYFLEVNTRLQVEHGVTEQVTGVDLVEWMVLQAAGALGDLRAVAPKSQGHSIQVRIYAEDPAKNFQPGAGKLSQVVWPKRARIETWVDSGSEISPFYDSMLAKVIVTAANREQAVTLLQEELDATEIHGLETNLAYLRQIVRQPGFREGTPTTAFLQSVPYTRAAVEVIEPGTQTTVQDYPGRLGYWHVGVPPSGPMDALAFRVANRIVGNSSDAPALEMAVSGPTLRFDTAATIAICGAHMQPSIDGNPVPLWQPFDVPAASTLVFGSVSAAGARCYLAVRGGFEIPPYLGSRSTFILGKFGGHAGRPLRPGDVLRLGAFASTPPSRPAAALQLKYTGAWTIGVLNGPHGSPDFFQPEYIETFFASDWTVHYNSDRTGIRLIGPKPLWSRKDGGEAGLHPSNIHDNAYAVGTVDFTGDMPVLLGPDGPSLGGFVCPATVVHAELWKLGQLRPGDTVRFIPMSQADAEQMDAALDAAIESLTGPLPQLHSFDSGEPPVLESMPQTDASPAVVCRADGDRSLLIEFGPNILDFGLRFQVHALEQRLRAENLPGIVDITPGIRSLQIHYNPRRLPRVELLEAVTDAQRSLRQLPDVRVPSRIVHLPLSWDDPQTQLAIRKYMQSVRPDAPWCPSNIEFIRRINGLVSVDEVHRIVFEASYMVLGLGDVYLGAPVATPVDPRHRLVTTKYNPARTWTPENAVGIGGAYLCVYGMEGPGGYQFVGRTVQMWNSHKTTNVFRQDAPWLLRFFDQIRFYPVSASELLECREAFPHGRFELKTEQSEFSLNEYTNFLRTIRGHAGAFKARQQSAFEEERSRWNESGQHEFSSAPQSPVRLESEESPVPHGCDSVRSPITASVWNIAVQQGERVEAGQRLITLEAMKMEVAVSAPASGFVEEIRCAPGGVVNAGQNLVILRASRAAA